MNPQNRHDPYGAVHKGLRAAHMRCLVMIGATDPNRDSAIEHLVRDLTDHLAMCQTHLDDEETFLHAALETRRPGASRHASEDHDAHERSFEDLSALLARLSSCAPSARNDVLSDLYRRFCRFVADDLLHMDHEEQVLLPDLQETFSDLELHEIEARIVAAIPLDRMVLFLDAMLDGLPAPISTAMLDAMRAGMPGDAFTSLMRDVTQRRALRASLASAA